MAKAFVLQDSTHGHTENLARVVADGARSEGGDVTVKRDWRNSIRRTFSNAGCQSPHPKELSVSAAVSSTFSRRFRRVVAGLAASLALGTLSAHAAPTPFPADFRTSQVVNDDATINVRVGGHGPAVVLIHGFGETGDMWSPMAAALEKDHTVIVPDLRGMGLSSHPAGGYDKWTQAGDIRAALDNLGIDRADIVGHDIGVMVAYAYAARYPDKTSRLVVIDSPIPGIPPWNQIVRMPALWHFNFGGRDAERLVGGRERIYLDRFWDEFAGDPSKIDEATRRHYAAIYARPGAMHSAFAQFLAIDQKDEADNLKAMQTKLTMPVLAIGAEKAFGANVAVQMRNAATNVQEVIVPNAGHWLMDEAPAPTIAAVQNFLAAN
ncbi:pimeloyl-ACP methyl ester carboxylesterase [Paraburkholderia sp. GAS32]